MKKISASISIRAAAHKDEAKILPVKKRAKYQLVSTGNVSGEFKKAARVLWLVPMLFLLPFCASKSDLAGNWKEAGKAATIEFSEDGTFKAVDNQGMAVSGKYTPFKDGLLRCEIQREGETVEVVNLKISIRGDELTLTSPDDTEVERYIRER
jgi:hypothetical protein